MQDVSAIDVKSSPPVADFSAVSTKDSGSPCARANMGNPLSHSPYREVVTPSPDSRPDKRPISRPVHRQRSASGLGHGCSSDHRLTHCHHGIPPDHPSKSAAAWLKWPGMEDGPKAAMLSRYDGNPRFENAGNERIVLRNGTGEFVRFWENCSRPLLVANAEGRT